MLPSGEFMKILDVSLRLVLLVWAYFEFLGYAWGGGLPGSLVDVYALAPLVALLLGAAVPNSLFAKTAGAVVYCVIGLLALARSIYLVQVALNLPNGGDLGAAGAQVITVALILLVLTKIFYLMRHPSRRNPPTLGTQ